MSRKSTSVRCYYGELSLHVETTEAMTPEGVETMVNRVGRQFIAMSNELDGIEPATDDTAEILAALEEDE